MSPFPVAPGAGQAARRALVDAEPRVFWTAQPGRPPIREPLTEVDRACDLAIVGAGFTGLWAAIQAKEDNPSLDVVVLDQGRVGDGASGRNGGFVAPSLTHGLHQGVSLWPDEIDLLEEMAAANFAGVQASLERYGIDADFHLPGEITLSLSEHQDGAVREAHALHREQGHDVTYLTREESYARVRSPLYRCGFVDPTVGLVDPARLVWGLAAAAESLGVTIHEMSKVTGFEDGGGGSGAVVVKTEAGSVLAGRVVLGTGAWPVLNRTRLYVLPVYDHVLMTEPLSVDQLVSIGWEGREGLADAGNQFHYYRRTRDDRVLFGGYDANYHFPGRIDPSLEQSESHTLLAEHFLSIFPQLEGVRFTHRWGGVIDTTSRFTPMFGTAMRGKVAYAVGYTGLGVGSTRWGARVALDLVFGHDTERTRLAMVRRKPVPFPPEPVRSLGVRLTRASLAREDSTGERNLWLKGLDRLGIGFDS
ncbi:MAG: FAD-binding oxidoreductase [Intrasporangiaceae bacterium]|nr:FAD-binding oxidoreductase [Intrasporangiaceae bacterium]